MKTSFTDMDLLSQFKQNWTQKHFANSGEAILLAVSGGLDSMTLAHLCIKAGIPVGIAHCNFGLRGEDADKDEQLAKEWSDQHKLAFYSTRFNTAAVAAEWKKGIQETARDLRYQWLEKIRKENGYKFIATAHHANDNTETLLMNLFRGTGLSGLHGIPERNGAVIRPLLFAFREQIREYAQLHEVPYREDASNSSDKYLRNAVRLNIIPAIEQYFPEVVTQLNESIDRFTQAELLYKQAVQQQLKKLVEKRGNNVYIPVRKLLKTEALEAVIYELFRQYGFSNMQVPQIISLATSGSGKYIDAADYRVIKDREFLIITQKASEVADFIMVDKAPVTIETERLRFKFSNAKATAFSDKASLATIDADKLTFPLVLRKWRTGDYFYPLGMGMKKKKLSRFFIDQKIPLHEKEQAWVLESGRKIVWIAGMRLDERFKIGPATKKVLKVEVRVH